MVQVSWLIAVWFVYGPSESHTVYFTDRKQDLWFVYGPSEGRTVHLTDRKQGLRPA